MEKPNNKYRKGSCIWSVLDGDWFDLTPKEVAECLGAELNTVYKVLYNIKKDTGYVVPMQRHMLSKEWRELNGKPRAE